MPRSGASGLRIKSPDLLIAESGADLQGHGLRRSMGLFQLICFGVGAIVGTGIFVGLSDTVAQAGPAVVVSFVLAAVTCIFTAFAFAELGGAIPVSGSSYSYAYATLGERAAFLVGWCLLLEYGVSVSAVAVGWGQYLNQLLGSLTGWQLPAALANPPGAGGIVNLPAVLVVLLAAVLLVRGVRESARATAAMAVLKLLVLVLFCVIGFGAFRSGNLSPFAPEGLAGITSGASVAFFSYIGFDSITTAGEEARNPRRDVPVAIMVCIGVVTVLYCLVALAAIGALSAGQVAGRPAALSLIVDRVTHSGIGGTVIAFGAVVAIASVVLAVMYGQTRILMSMARDGLVPGVFARVSPRTATPVANTWIVAGVFALPAAVVPLDMVMNLSSAGTLVAMAAVNVSVLILRRSRPDLPRRFRVPLYPLSPLLGIAFCGYLVYGTGPATWLQLAVFLVVGVVGYELYGRRHSRLSAGAGGDGTPGAGTGAAQEGQEGAESPRGGAAGAAPAAAPEGRSAGAPAVTAAAAPAAPEA
ncbi:amino acid permease [Streptomyces noursei]|uniref:amino acid permease n=1 Tax=Streptomyces noursei TaxID=1971 RepID=UPI001672906A|nr:amino acid permease [Streptomyces noursei]MCZ1018572.1 amino acid permease [Streptomyces noursei]GGX50130.1 amino acid permease [Streptomyces noursei]